MRKIAYIRSEPSNFIEIFLDGEAVGVFGSGEGDAILKKIEDYFGLCVSETVTSQGLRTKLAQREAELKIVTEEKFKAADNMAALLKGLHRIALGWRRPSKLLKSNASCLRDCLKSSSLRGLTYTKEGLNMLANALDDIEGTREDNCPTCGQPKE